jgi:hypothetical protein
MEARLEMDGLVYRGEIHATPINNTPPELTNESLWMIELGY